VLSRCAVAAAAIRRQRQTYSLLSSLDDRTLQDIGLNRTMLLSVSVHGGRSARDALPLPLLPDPDQKPRVLTLIRKLVSELRKRPAAEKSRQFQGALGPNQLKELLARAYGRPVDGSPTR
jgi:hypothetical protein